MEQFEQSLTLPIPREQLFDWHRRPGAFERLGPSWQRLEIVSQTGGTIEDGARLHFRAYEGPLWINWVARHEGFEAGRRFVDVAERCPFAAWRHVHAFEDTRDGGARLIDRVSYRLPLHALSRAVAGRQVEAMLVRMFRQRHVRTANDLRRHHLTRGRKRVALLGAAGLVDAQLAAFWSTGGHTIVRDPGQAAQVLIELDPALPGCTRPRAPIEHARWLAGAEVFIEVCAAGQRTPSAAHQAARRRGIRVVRLRTQVIVCRATGRAIRAAFAAPRRSGFIDLDDLLALVHHAALTPELEGDVDAVVGQLPPGFEPDFAALERSIAHQRGHADAGAVERALARWSALGRNSRGRAPE